MDGSGSSLRQVTLRVEHHCPMAELSRRFPQAEFRAWGGHRHEVVEAVAARPQWERIAAMAEALLRPGRLLPLRDGGLIVWEPKVDTRASISRILEAHGLVWMQPMRLRAGWEHYDAVAFGAAGEQRALDALRSRWPTQVVRRRDVGPEELTAALFLSLHPVLQAPTPKQREAILAAHRAGYYRSPRGATTAQVARRLGIGRSAFEERLRGAENRLMAALLPALAHEGGRDDSRLAPNASRPRRR
jgi:predicted DNA binding protein